MAPFKALPKTVGDAKKKGLVPMTDFFGPKVKRGRPQKAASKAGRLATKEVPPTTALPQAVLKPAPAPKIKDAAEELVQGRRLGDHDRRRCGLG